MKRTVVNIVIDATSFVIFVAMISTGLLLKFILPPGSGRVEMLTRGGGRFEKTIDAFMGMTRHEWGEIHFYIALAFLAALVVHLFLHWRWISAMTFGTAANPVPKKRKFIALVVFLYLVMALIFPWIGSKETYTKSEFMTLREIGEIEERR